jgi:hypothetical protein
MDVRNNFYKALPNLVDIDADNINTDNINANTGNITTGNITTINSTNINTANADIDNLTLPTLTASKLIRTNGANLIVSSTYDETDFARLSADNVFTGTTNTIPTISNTNLTSSKIKAPVYTGTTTSSNISIGETGDTGTTTLYKTINIPSLTASKIVLTDGSDNLVSSSFTDTDLLPKNNPTITGQLTLPLGSNTAPSLCFDNDTGLYSSGGGNINFTTNSTERLNIVDTINPKAQIRHIQGSNSTPAYSFITDIDSGMYQGTAGEVDIACNSQNIINFSTSGVKIPILTARKIVLTDDNDRLVSSTFTDTDLAPLASPTFTGIATFPDIVLNNSRVSLGSSQTTTSLTTGCLIGNNLSNGGFNNVGMINSTGTLITAGGANRFYVSQLRNAQLNAGVLLYDNTTKEVSYSATLPTLTTSGLTISGLTASRALVSNGSKALTSASFNLPSISGTNGFLLTTDGVETTSWFDPLSLPISTLTQSALNDKAPLASPTFTGIATFPDIVLNNDRVSLGTSQTKTGLNTGILLGKSLSNNSFDNVIMLNASGTLYSANGVSRFFVNPIRNVALTSGVLLYDASTKEVGYSVSPTLTSITAGSATITGLTANRAVITDGFDNLASATFNLPTTSGTSSYILTTNGVSSTSWADPTGLPISSATQTALNQKAPLASPTFTGIATFPDIVLNNTRISLGSTQTTTGLTTGVMIGSSLSNNSFINNIMLNGTGTLITSGGASRLYIAPIRNIGLTSGALLYDASTKEVSYSATPTLTSITAGSATITGLSANRAVLTDINDALVSTTFNLPTTSGTSGFVLRTDGVATTSWVDLATQSAVSSKAPLASPTFTGQVVVPKGSVSSPSIAFGSADLNTGIYSPFDDTFAVALNGVQKLVMTTTTFEPKDVIKAIVGTNTAPCFTFQADANAGLYQSAVNNIDIAVNQVNKVNITQTLFHSKNNIQMTSASTDTYLTHGSGNTLFKTSGLSGKYITSNIYAGAQTDTWSVLETNADGETAAFCQNGDTSIIINPADSDALWFIDEDTMTTATNYAWTGWKITLAGVLVASSDRRLKRDINKIEKQNLLDNLLDVNIVKYKMKPPSEDKLYKNGVLRKKYQQEHMGVIGQNIKKNFPDVIEEQDNGDEEKLISVKYQDLSYYFHLGTQELIRKVQVLEEENKTLRTEIDKIKIFLNIQ